ncbi:sodium:calcium antiporter, partial [Candidatus Uhrbacteria bacterium]|nr:sodium:calcium antiporter [Candidatus Uhrbacteria bacterium]
VSSARGVPSFGLGTLFGSNVADLTLVFVILIFSTRREIRVGSKILENNRWYPALLALPIFFGLDGYYSRSDGVILVASGLLFYVWILKRNHRGFAAPEARHRPPLRNFLYLLLSMAALLWGASLTVRYGVVLAELAHISPALIGMLIVGLGTTLPELFFSLRAVKKRGDELALGDVLGTVISDATIVVGLLALADPFFFPKKIVYSTAVFMVIASLMLFSFLRSGRRLTKKEGVILFLFYIIFVLVEYWVNVIV